MNLYKIHTNPSSLVHSENAESTIPEVFVKDVGSLVPKFPAEMTESQLKSVSRHAGLALAYAAEFIKGRWPEAEPFIMKDPVYACDYAYDVLKKRWPEAEPFIMKSPLDAYVYARDVIQDRWPEAEPIIKKNARAWEDYCQAFGIP